MQGIPVQFFIYLKHELMHKNTALIVMIAYHCRPPFLVRKTAVGFQLY